MWPPSILEDYSQGRRWKDHAILYRMNAQSNQMENALQEKRHPLPHHRRHPLL